MKTILVLYALSVWLLWMFALLIYFTSSSADAENTADTFLVIPLWPILYLIFALKKIWGAVKE